MQTAWLRELTAFASNHRGNSRDPQARGTPSHPYYSHTTPNPESLEVWEWYGSGLWEGGRSTLEKSLHTGGVWSHRWLYVPIQDGPRADRYKWSYGGPENDRYKWLSGVITPINIWSLKPYL